MAWDVLVFGAMGLIETGPMSFEPSPRDYTAANLGARVQAGRQVRPPAPFQTGFPFAFLGPP